MSVRSDRNEKSLLFTPRPGNHDRIITVLEDEDCGFFWSNDPRVTIREMAESIQIADWSTEHARLKKLFLGVRSGQRTESRP